MDYDVKTKVGWRGPAINCKDASALPEYVVHYDTWWNDYVPFKHADFLKIKRINDIYQSAGKMDEMHHKYAKYKTK